MNRYNSKFTMVSLYLISAILALIIIIEAIHITPALAQTTGSYIKVSRIINIPKNMPNSSSNGSGGSLSNGNPSLPDGISNGILISPVVNSYQQISLMFL
jgi:uncharacterized membrane protein